MSGTAILGLIDDKEYFEAFKGIEKLLGTESFDREEAYEILERVILSNVAVLKEVIRNERRWYAPIISSFEMLPEETRKKAATAAIVSAVYHNDLSEAKRIAGIIGIEADFESSDYVAISKMEIFKEGTFEALYMKMVMEEVFQKDKGVSLWLVSGKEAFEKKIRVAVTNRKNIELFPQAIADGSINSSASKAFIALHRLFRIKKETGAVIYIDGIAENDKVDGLSGTLAIFIAIYQEIFKRKFEKAAFIADIDPVSLNLLPVDGSGLRRKVEAAIRSGIEAVYISEKNHADIYSYAGKIEIMAVKNVEEIFKTKSGASAKPLVYALSTLAVLLGIAAGYFGYNNSKYIKTYGKFNGKNSTIAVSVVVKDAELKEFLKNISGLSGIKTRAEKEIEKMRIEIDFPKGATLKEVNERLCAKYKLTSIIENDTLVFKRPKVEITPEYLADTAIEVFTAAPAAGPEKIMEKYGEYTGVSFKNGELVIDMERYKGKYIAKIMEIAATSENVSVRMENSLLILKRVK